MQRFHEYSAMPSSSSDIFPCAAHLGCARRSSSATKVITIALNVTDLSLRNVESRQIPPGVHGRLSRWPHAERQPVGARPRWRMVRPETHRSVAMGPRPTWHFPRITACPNHVHLHRLTCCPKALPISTVVDGVHQLRWDTEREGC